MDHPESHACSSTYPSEATITAEIVNQTHQVLDMKVGNSVYFVHMAQLARGATHTVLVDYSDTYQEYQFSPRRTTTIGDDSSSGNLVVTSDECCDYKRITITEVDGQLEVQREPRLNSGEWNLQNVSAAAAPPPPPPPPPGAPKRDCRSYVGESNWKWWIRLRLF